MVHLVNSMSALSGAGLCNFPFRDSIVLWMGFFGMICLAAAAAIALREQTAVPATVRIEIEQQ